MPITLGTNIASLGIQRQLAKTSDQLSTVFERLASGQRINRASDDAAGLAVATTLSARTRVYTQALRNVNDGVSALTIADGAVGQLKEIVTRQKELAAQAANGTYATAQRQALDTEAQALAQEYNRIIQTTTFNSQKLLDGSNPIIALQAGIGAGAILDATILGNTSTTSQVDAGTTTDTTIDYGSAGVLPSVTFLVGDLNKDGIQDIVALSMMGETDVTTAGQLDVAIYLGNTSGTFTAPNAYAFRARLGSSDYAGGTLNATLSDTNADGYLDIRVSATLFSGGTGSEVEEFTNQTGSNGGVFKMDMAFNDALAPSGNNTIGGGASVGDFNGDGISDNLVNNHDGTYTIGIHNTVANTTFTTQSLSQSSISLLSQSSARSAMDSLETVFNTISTISSNIGASLSRISSASNVLDVTRVNYAAAGDRIMSADVASESANLVRQNILQSAASSVMAQANQQPAIALALLR